MVGSSVAVSVREEAEVPRFVRADGGAHEIEEKSISDTSIKNRKQHLH